VPKKAIWFGGAQVGVEEMEIDDKVGRWWIGLGGIINPREQVEVGEPEGLGFDKVTETAPRAYQYFLRGAD